MEIEMTTVLLIVGGLLIVAFGGYAWYLHTKGVPRERMPTQFRMKVGDDLDELKDNTISAVRRFAVRLPQASLKDGYFDTDNFNQDIGRLPDTFESMVTLTRDGVNKIIRDGKLPAIEYVLDANSGNVLLKEAAK